MRRKKKEKFKCEHDIGLTVEEEDALNWLRSTLDQGAKQCGPTSGMSHTAHVAVGKVFDQMHGLHSKVHALERELKEAEIMVAGMAGLPRNLGIVKEEDFN